MIDEANASTTFSSNSDPSSWEAILTKQNISLNWSFLLTFWMVLKQERFGVRFLYHGELLQPEMILVHLMTKPKYFGESLGSCKSLS